MSVSKEKILIIDGNALIHRSFHALPPTLMTKKGQMVNAVYGFTAVLLKALREFSPEYVVLTLDRPEPTFRHKKYKEYKATRIKAPQELYDQIPWIKKIARSFQIPIYEKVGVEADDLIGTIVKNINTGIEKIIVTGDLDTLQLVDKNTKVFTMSRGVGESVLYNERAVEERFGISPRQMVDYKALRGDPSDNIPGVKGIGEKTAVMLLKEFKTLDNLYNNLDSSKIKQRIKKLLKKYKDNAFLSRNLATIKTDVPLNFDLTKARFNPPDTQEIAKIFSQLEFKSLLPRLYELTKKNFSGSFEESKDKFERNLKLFNYILIDDEKKFSDFLKKLKNQKRFAFDTETTSFNPIQSELLGISFSWKKGNAYYLRFTGRNLTAKNLLEYRQNKEMQGIDIDKALKKIKTVLEDKKAKKIGHNIKYDIQVMENYDIQVQGVVFDTRIASYILNPGTRQHNLDTITFAYLGHQKISKEDLFKNKKTKIEFKNLPIEKLFNYSCEDDDFTYRLFYCLKKELKKQKLYSLFKNIEIPLIEVLANMERNGVKIDVKFLKEKSQEFSQRIHLLTQKAHKLAGVEFNLNSTQQLREVLFEKLKLPVTGIKKGKTGFSTSAEELVKLKNVHPIIKLIQENRELQKLKNTYIDALPKLINPKTKRVHTSFNQTATATGRLSSQNPNLQNIPVRTREGKEIRRAFIAEKGYKLLALDYSQIELRLAASLSNDKEMIKAFKNGKDIHKETAAKIYNVKIEEVTPEMRRQAKAINFGILYGQGARGLSQTADIPYLQAQEFIQIYFSVFSGVKRFIDATIEKAREKGYVETLFGRRRYLPEINSDVPLIKKASERMAINAPLQGSAADMIKVAMISVYDMIRKKYEKKEIKMILQVHDELIFEVKEKQLKEAAFKIKKIMENVVKLKVPVVADIEYGDNWGEMKKMENS